jgi:hypothetical protein
VAAARVGQVDDLLGLVCIVGARVPEYPLPPGFGVGESFGGTALAAGEPYAGGDRNDVDHKIQD